MTPPRNLLLLVVVVTSVAAAAAPARAGAIGEAELAAARNAYQNMDYERVISLASAVVRRPAASAAQRVEALELTGLSQLILGRQARARASFEALLELSPDHKLKDPSGSPKLRRFFETVRKEHASAATAATSPTLSPEQVKGARGGQTLTIVVQVKGDAGKVAQAMLRWRSPAETSWQGQPMIRKGADLTARFTLPSSPRAYQLRYLVEVRDSSGNLLTRSGTEQQPLTAEVAAGTRVAPKPVWKRWWFWTVIGTVVVGGVTAGAIVLSSESAPQGNLQPGVVQLR